MTDYLAKISIVLASAALVVLVPTVISADEAESHSREEPTTQLTLPDQVELHVLITLVSEQLDMQIVFDDQLANKRITIKTPHEVPTSSLRGILESALQINQLALVEDDQPGWFRIVQANDLKRFAGPISSEPVDGAKAFTVITHVFELAHTSPTSIEGIVRPFLTEAGRK